MKSFGEIRFFKNVKFPRWVEKLDVILGKNKTRREIKEENKVLFNKYSTFCKWAFFISCIMFLALVIILVFYLSYQAYLQFQTGPKTMEEFIAKRMLEQIK